ncbi:MAG: hypothetical protein E7106_09195 [Prevotella sp.]|nr:hypothetical protein [Prevotella sp.]
MTDTLLDKISKHSNNTYITDAWLTGQTGEIVDLKGDCIFRFVDYDTEGELRIKYITEESQLSCPIVACGFVGYWLHKKDTEGTKAIFDGYYELCLKNYEKAHECDDDAWERDLKKEFVCRHHVPTEKKKIKASEALFPYITESDQKKVKSIMANYLKYANSKRIELYPEEESPQNDNSDFEHLKVWEDNPDLKYYLSDKHWNSHVNQLLYAYLTSRYKGNEVGVYINLGLLNGSAFKIDYNQIYGVMFNEAYSFCRYVLTTPVPETEITFLESKAESLCSVKIAKPIIAYNILVMTGLILCFSNDQNEVVGRFLNRLSGYNHTHYFGDEFHHFENYIKIGLNVVAGIMIDGQLQHPGKLRPGYDYKGHDEYLRKTLPWYRVSAEMFEKRVEKSSSKTNEIEKILNEILNKVEEQTEMIRKLEPCSYSNHQQRSSAGQSKPGRKQTKFTDYIISKEDYDNVIGIINKHIVKDNPQQVALVIIGGIEAGKIRQDVTAPSIEKEFGVNRNSVKPYLTNYRTTRGKPNPTFSETELQPFKDFFIE